MNLVVQIFQRDSIALYDEQIEFRLIHKHSSTHTSVIVSRSSCMFA